MTSPTTLPTNTVFLTLIAISNLRHELKIQQSAQANPEIVRLPQVCGAIGGR